MKKITFKGLIILLFLLMAAATWSGVTNFDAITVDPGSTGDTYGIRVNNSSGTRVFSVDENGAVYIASTLTATISRSVPLPLVSFIISTGTTSTPITVATAPGWEQDDLIPSLVWADGETSPVMITFRVPSDYSSGGAFRVFSTASGTSTANEVDFVVYVNRNGSAADAAATDQTPMAVGQSSTSSVVTLTVATDFASLAAGDWVTFGMWRDDTATGTDDLEIKGVEFFYTASQ